MDKEVCYLVVTAFAVVTTFGGSVIYPALAQRSTNGNMTSAMVESARLHLKLADQALMNGNTKAAVDQLNLADLQLSMSNMKAAGTLNQTQEMQFMKGGRVAGISASNIKAAPDFCIFDNEGKLECRYPR
jgi:hypothetical protein